MSDVERQIWNKIDTLQEKIMSFIQRIVRIPSLPGNEKEVQDVIASKLKEMDLVVEILPVSREKIQEHPAFSDDGFPYDNRLCVIGVWEELETQETQDHDKSLILNGHVDVVSPGNEELWTDSPWSGKIKGERIYGRGVLDMKSGLSAAIFAIQVLKELGYAPRKKVILESVVGEETGGCGTLTTILNGITADAAIVLEPTNFTICPVQAGALTFRLKIRGKSVHAAMKDQGISAIEKFYVILHAIDEYDRKRHAKYKHSLFKNPKNVAPISIGKIQSGDWPSTIPNELIAEGRLGVFPGESVESAKHKFLEMIRKSIQNDEWLKNNPPYIEWFEGQFESGETALNEPIISQLKKCHIDYFKKIPGIEGVTYGSDLRLFTNYARIPTVLYGPGDVMIAHGVDEWINIKDIMNAVKMVALLIFRWCGLKKIE